jgi:hypothetical protein
MYRHSSQAHLFKNNESNNMISGLTLDSYNFRSSSPNKDMN